MVMGELTQHTELLVIGAGPGGYAAALRAAELGLEVTLVDPSGRAGGVCLFSGCIPSKALLHLTSLIGDAQGAAAMGVRFAPPQIDLEAMRGWKRDVVDSLARRLHKAIAAGGIQLLRGRAEFESSERVRLHGGDVSRMTFNHCIVAVGTRAAHMADTPATASGHILTASRALALAQVPSSVLVIGAGATGLELGTIYAALGSRVVLLEQREGLLPDVDRDLTAPLERRLSTLLAEMHFNCTAVALREVDTGVQVTFEGQGPDPARTYDQVLMAVGRNANSNNLGLEHTGVLLDKRGYILVDDRQRTHDARIYAVGDVTGGLLLAHKAIRQGKVAAEVIAGRPSDFDVRAVPAVIYTDPQIAWCGLTEGQARQQKRSVRIRRFEWAGSERAATLGLVDGLTKIVADPESGRILGVGVCGRHAENLIAEGALAVEMGALTEDLALTLHPYPTLSETEAITAALFESGAEKEDG
jgi:dihydrolipoamide dehydrogenase